MIARTRRTLPLAMPPRRRWWQPSLAGLMGLVVVVGGGTGWVAHVIRTQRAALAAMNAAQANLWFDYEGEIALVPGSNPPVYRAEPAAPGWVRRWLGDELFQSVNRVEMVAPRDDATWRHLAEFAGLQSLSLYYPEPSTGGLAHLRDLRGLASIEIEGAGVTDRVLGEVARIRRVDSLDFRSVPASDAGFASLAQIDGVTLAWFADCPHLTDATLAHLVARWPHLEDLVVRGAGPERLTMTLATLAAHCPALRNLELQGTRVVDADLATLARLTSLTTLDLTGTAITDEGTTHLRPLVRLTGVTLAETAVTDRTLAVAAGWPGLLYLNLRQTAVTGSGLGNLARVPIRSLDLDGSLVGDAQLPALGTIPTLTWVDLQNLPRVTAAGVAALPARIGVRCDVPAGGGASGPKSP